LLIPVKSNAWSAVWLLVFMVLNKLAARCFKECGTDAARTWTYFVVGNILGPLSLIFLMLAYARMNANVVAAIAIGGGAIVVQVTFGLAYGSHLTLSQWAGIALAIVGAVLATAGGQTRTPAAEAVQSADGPRGTP